MALMSEYHVKATIWLSFMETALFQYYIILAVQAPPPHFWQHLSSLPHVHAQGVKQSVCMSVIVVVLVIVVVHMKIACLGNLGA